MWLWLAGLGASGAASTYLWGPAAIVGLAVLIGVPAAIALAHGIVRICGWFTRVRP